MSHQLLFFVLVGLVVLVAVLNAAREVRRRRAINDLIREYEVKRRRLNEERDDNG